MNKAVLPSAQQTAESIGDALPELLYAFVLPLFAGFLESGAAERAAKNAVRFYRPRTYHEAMLAARTIAFDLAAQDNLRLAMAADQTVTAKLRLGANASALDRSMHRNHAALEKCRATQPATPNKADLDVTLPDAKGMIAQTNAGIAAAKAVATPSTRHPVAPAPAAGPVQAAPAKPAAVAAPPEPSLQLPRTADPRDKVLWANAMTTVAQEMTAGLSALPPAHRKQEQMRARLLSSVASDVTMRASGTPAPPQT